MKSKLAVLKSASQSFLFMKVSGGVVEMLEIDLNSVKLCFGFFSFLLSACTDFAA